MSKNWRKKNYRLSVKILLAVSPFPLFNVLLHKIKMPKNGAKKLKEIKMVKIDSNFGHPARNRLFRVEILGVSGRLPEPSSA